MEKRDAQALRPGTRIGALEIRGLLGTGNYGITYRAVDHALDRRVAVKEYFPGGLALRVPGTAEISPISEAENRAYKFGLERFVKEARTLARFDHPNIVRVQQYLVANGTGYLVMNYEAGRSLGYVLRRMLRLKEHQARAVAIHMLRGLKALHSQDFLHRDVKPGNILVRRSGPPLLLDFGAARQALEHRMNNRGHTVMLTPGYAPIEQYGRRENQGPWSDIYALGATLFHCIVGNAPAAATDRLATAAGTQSDPVDAGLDYLRGLYSSDLTDTVAWMMQPYSADRPQHADDVLKALSSRKRVDRTLSGTDIYAGQTLGEHSLDGSRTGHEPFDSAVTRKAEEFLTSRFGSRGRVILKRAARQCTDEQDLLARISAELEDEADRIDLLEACADRPAGAETLRPASDAAGREPRETGQGEFEPAPGPAVPAETGARVDAGGTDALPRNLISPGDRGAALPEVSRRPAKRGGFFRRLFARKSRLA